MADRKQKWELNKRGKYYVDSTCIDCDACRSEAPENFVRNDNEGHSYVEKQPENEEEEARCKAAMEACPVEAIGADGEGDDDEGGEEQG